MKLNYRISPKLEFTLGCLTILILIIQMLPINKGVALEKVIVCLGWILIVYFLLSIFRLNQIKNSIWGKIILIFFAVFIVGILFKLTHWQWYQEIILVAMFGIAISYLLKKLFDESESPIYAIVKLLYVFSLLLLTFFNLRHYLGSYTLFVVNRISLIVLIFVYLLNKRKGIPQKSY